MCVLVCLWLLRVGKRMQMNSTLKLSVQWNTLSFFPLFVHWFLWSIVRDRLNFIFANAWNCYFDLIFSSHNNFISFRVSFAACVAVVFFLFPQFVSFCFVFGLFYFRNSSSFVEIFYSHSLMVFICHESFQSDWICYSKSGNIQYRWMHLSLWTMII